MLSSLQKFTLNILERHDKQEEGNTNSTLPSPGELNNLLRDTQLPSSHTENQGQASWGQSPSSWCCMILLPLPPSAPTA